MDKLPIYDIHGIPFEVNAESGELIYHRSGTLALEFRAMKDMGTHYLAYFDTKRHQLVGYRGMRPEFVEVKIPQMVELDPRGVAKMYTIDVSQLPGRDSELRCESELFRQRKSGKQPIIDIYGYTYFVKLAFDMLEPKDFTKAGISLWDMLRPRFGSGYRFMFDTVDQRLIRKKERQNPEALRGRAVWVNIPHVSVLDPYIFQGFHRREGTPDMLRFPIRYNLKARIFDLDGKEIPSYKIGKRRSAPPKKKKGLTG
ncbi:hypothetical protein JHJ32_07410 [Parapedobacter sp. ISTM3]|uniref:hypothetical protein n=1 Tax=Parapedobacter sp. ISTM3 TaxID=2800130 RepID=UPI001908BD77|nr:hypothetical protein [Parapedobacter sp. ISTM3]MBK1439805.1 hypothetical protein [Parapedobacter sp. ISTM3]